MRRLLTIIAILFVNIIAMAQAPSKMSYQAVIRSNNALVVSTQIGMRVSIIRDSASGLNVYQETYNPQPTTNANGLVSVEIGGGNPSIGLFENIDWSASTYFVKIETDVSGGTNYTNIGVSQLLSVPYALYAKIADSVKGGTVISNTHFIGQEFGGGVIFHLWKDNFGGEHGLILDKLDLSSAQIWSNRNILIGASAQNLWDGMNNSSAIISQTGHNNSAAGLCINSSNGGQNDWYLPSVQEFNVLWNNYFIVQKVLNMIPNATQLSQNLYWTSTELSQNTAWSYYWNEWPQMAWNPNIDYTKSNLLRVRAIRSF